MLLLVGVAMFLTLDGPQVTVQSLEGPSQSGKLIRFSDTGATLEKSGVESAILRSDILSLQLTESKSVEPNDPSQLLLKDGSRLNVRTLQRTGEQITGDTSLLGTVNVPANQIRAIRIQPRNPAYDIPWNGFLARTDEKDLLIVPKTEGEGLDFLSGIIGNITADEISMLLDGENFPVPVDRVYGIVFGSSKSTVSSNGLSLTTTAGDVVHGSSVGYENETWTVQSSWGQELTIVSSHLTQVDFSGDRLKYLADLAPVQEVFDGIDPPGSAFAGLIDEESARLLYGPRRNTSLDSGTPMRLRGTQYNRGLCVHSKTTMVWDLGSQYSSLDFILGVDDRVAFNQKSQVSIRITGDDQVLFEKVVGTQDPAEPVRISLDGVASLTILVDFADSDSSCDWLDLAEARLIKTAAGTTEQ